MSKGSHDTFIVDDDDEECCPLCVEDFDLTDKGFKPCPCGYQICQFCYNNVKVNMNGLCPACRRPYNDKDIEYKLITPEETAAHKARQAQKQKKTQQALQKEKQRAEADSLSRKHLAGLRVVQKNLVYVTGLSPNLNEDELLQTLRGSKYFGQYGNIIKIVVSKARDKHDSVGVYVTYEFKEDAASCVAAVDGSANGERTLRAQFGTTKYCSAYLRGDTCMNRNCMFLHEPGDGNESYSRADLSNLNAGSTQHGGLRHPPPQSQQPVSAAQPMARQESDQSHSPTNVERPGLPSTASWASRPPPTQASRVESRVPSGSVGSPAPTIATPVPVQAEPVAPSPAPEPTPPPAAAPVQQPAPRLRVQKQPNPLNELLRLFNPQDLRLAFSTVKVSPDDVEILTNYPALFESNGGAKRRSRKEKEEEQRRADEEAQAFVQAAAADAEADTEDAPEMSGSLQLGGEPEEPQGRNSIPQPTQDGALDRRFQFGGSSSGLDDQGLTQQHQQLLLQTMKSPNLPAYQQSAFQQPSHPPGHQRNVSRFSFANDSSASTAVKPVANQKLMSQQHSMMPSAGSNHFGNQHQPQAGQFFTSNVQGPPPGLKTTGTPPVSGGMTFGQGHGFTTGGLQYGANTGGRNANEEMMRDLLRSRNASVAGSDAAKRELHSFPYGNAASGVANFPASAYQGSTPAPYSSSISSYGGDGEKQRGNKKNKGKKHRHATTNSSSGGAGLVDAADNHLLQTRLQHGGLGGGPFGGSTPSPAAGDDSDFPPLVGTPILSRRGSLSLQELSRRGTPSVPPGFEADVISRRGTPTVPPGFSKLPTAVLADLDKGLDSPTDKGIDRVIGRPVPEGTPSRTASRAGLKRMVSAQVVPVLPLRPGTPSRAMSRTASRAVSRPSSPVKKEEKEEEVRTVEETPTKKPRAVVPKALEKEKEKEVVKGKENEKPVVAKVEEKKEVVVPVASVSEKAELSKEVPAQVKSALAQPSMEVEQVKPAKGKVAVLPEPKTPAVPAAQPIVEAKVGVEVKPAPVTPSKVDTNKSDAKRKHPGKLDITAAVEKQKTSIPATTATPVDTSTPGKQPKSLTQTPSILDSPSTNAPSPVVKTAARTLRVVQTPKAEAPPPAPPTAAPALPTPAEAVIGKRFPSRQPSVASMNLPGTPSSELISDNISLTSTSLSRANSPPPPGAGKVGSAPVRTKTKAQQRKDRKAYAQAIEEEQARLEAEEKSEQEEVKQEAIVSRKKKERKAKPAVSVAPKGKAAAIDTKTADTTPSASRPASPPSATAKERVVIPEAVAKAVSKPATPTKVTQQQQQQQQIAQPPQQPTRELSPPPTPTLSPAQIIADIRAAHPQIQKALESLFRTSSTANLKPSQPITPKDLQDPTTWKPGFDIKLTQDEILGLLGGTVPAVTYGGAEGRDWDRGLVSPSGAHLRALSQSLETRFLELENALRNLPEELRFHPTKPQNETKLPGFDLEALKSEFEMLGGRGVSVMEAMVQDGSGMKKGAFLVDEAGRYVNEFVMPPATPPPSHVAQAAGMVGGPVGGVQQAAAGAQGGQGGGKEGPVHVPGVEIAERQLQEARRAADEKEGALRRVIRRNKKMLGLG